LEESSSKCPEGFAEGCKAIDRALVNLGQVWGLPPSRVVVGGFALGGGMALRFTLRRASSVGVTDSIPDPRFSPTVSIPPPMATASRPLEPLEPLAGVFVLSDYLPRAAQEWAALGVTWCHHPRFSFAQEAAGGGGDSALRTGHASSNGPGVGASSSSSDSSGDDSGDGGYDGGDYGGDADHGASEEDVAGDSGARNRLSPVTRATALAKLRSEVRAERRRALHDARAQVNHGAVFVRLVVSACVESQMVKVVDVQDRLVRCKSIGTESC
jgi:hypothetical protein